MIEVLTLDAPHAPGADAAVRVLETGGLAHLPDWPFALEAGEADVLDAELLAPRSKNVSFDPASGALGGIREGLGPRRARLAAALARYARFADAVLEGLCPGYGGALQKRRTSFRPAPIETRALSPRKDDKRLHVDAFPSSPVQGRRILRVFTNANPAEARRWRVGEEGFEAMARRFAPGWRPSPLTPALEALRLTRGRRTPYDEVMLRLHDRAKLDDGYQAAAAARALDFAPGSTWVVFTDGVMHAAMAGQHAFEQTYLLPVEAMADPSASPLRQLERMLGRPLL